MILVRRAIILAVNMSLELLGALQNSNSTAPTGVTLDIDNQTYQVVGGNFTIVHDETEIYPEPRNSTDVAESADWT